MITLEDLCKHSNNDNNRDVDVDNCWLCGHELYIYPYPGLPEAEEREFMRVKYCPFCIHTLGNVKGYRDSNYIEDIIKLVIDNSHVDDFFIEYRNYSLKYTLSNSDSELQLLSEFNLILEALFHDVSILQLDDKSVIFYGVQDYSGS